ncbi:MAG: hypothetical protein Hals2KO_12810 [Halioglobus sp.]
MQEKPFRREIQGEKQRLREEIAAQVDEFLRQGGEIDVLTQIPQVRMRVTGDSWHNQFDTPLNVL